MDNAKIHLAEVTNTCLMLYILVLGSPNRPGSNGENGRPGSKGEPGIPGGSIDGVKGPQGFKGADGLPGIVGLKGMPGEPGRDGGNGDPGTSGEMVRKLFLKHPKNYSLFFMSIICASFRVYLVGPEQLIC